MYVSYSAVKGLGLMCCFRLGDGYCQESALCGCCQCAHSAVPRWISVLLLQEVSAAYLCNYECALLEHVVCPCYVHVHVHVHVVILHVHTVLYLYM